MMKKVYLFIFAIACVIMLDAQSLVVGTYNIRNDNQYDVERGNGWQRRAPMVTQLVGFHDFDIIGMQELLHNQVEDILRSLPQYAYSGVGRDDGATKGEYSPIFYKTERFELLKDGHFWLSDREDYPNKGWDAALPRICCWVYLQDKLNKKKIWFFNLHMDHVGVEARKNSAKLILSKIEKMCGQDAVVLTGDFNIDQTNEGYKLLARSGVLFDSYEQAKMRYVPNGTFNDFKANLVSNSRIDHVFVSRAFVVDRYGVLTDSYRTSKVNDTGYDITDSSLPAFEEEGVVRMPSDHFPVKVVLDYSK
jgi:endonuclease/exonuclease/phosphatase family metal-dependent hydrolase